MSLTIAERQYYLPNSFIYQTSSNNLLETTQTYNRGNIIPGVRYEVDNSFNKNNGQGDNSIVAIRNTNPLQSIFSPILTATTGYELFISPVEATIPTSFYNIYNIDGDVGNNSLVIGLYISDADDFVRQVDLTQGTYTPNSLAENVASIINNQAKFYNTLTTETWERGGSIPPSPPLIELSADSKFTVEYIQSSRKFKFFNSLKKTDNAKVEVRFFFNFFIVDDVRSNAGTIRPGLLSTICLSPLGFIPPTSGNKQLSIAVGGLFEPELVEYWRVRSEDRTEGIDINGIFFSPKCIDLRRATNLYVIVDFDTGSSTDKEDDGDNSRVLFDIPIPYLAGGDEALPGSLDFDPQDSAFKSVSRLPGSTSISKIGYQIVDSLGATIDLNGVNWSLTVQISQQPTNNIGTELLQESMETYLQSIPAFDRGNVNTLSNITQELNPEKLADFKERMKKLKGKITFDSILNNLQAEKSQIRVVKDNTNDNKIIPDIEAVKDVGFWGIPNIQTKENQEEEEEKVNTINKNKD